jgi:hypothetical protein
MEPQEKTSAKGPSTLVSVERYKSNPKVRIIRGSRIKLTPEGVDALARLVLGISRNSNLTPSVPDLSTD